MTQIKDPSKNKAVVTGRRINPAFLARSGKKTMLRSAAPLVADHELISEQKAVESVLAEKEPELIVEAAPQKPAMEIKPEPVVEPVVEVAPPPSLRVHEYIPERKIQVKEPVASAPREQKKPHQERDKAAPQKTAPAVVAPPRIVRPEPVYFDESGDFASMLAEMGSIKEASFNAGDKVKATIIHLSADTAFLSLGQKAEGAMDIIELLDEDGQLAYKVGDRIECFVVKAQGEIRLSKKLGKQAVDWEMLQSAKENAIPVDGKIEKTCKGGYEVSVAGIRAFCPQGQIDIAFSEDAEAWVGKTESFLVTQVSESGRNLVLSRRALQENERKQSEAALLQTISIGDMLEGTISRLMPFGAFVDIGGAEGLIPLSQLSHGYVTKVEECVKIGDTVTVQVLKIEADPKREGRMRIGLSLKAFKQDPFQEYADKLVAGTSLSAKVVRVEKYGVFVSLFPGVDGLIHVSEIDKVKGKSGSGAYALGQMIDVRILDVDWGNKRLSLALGDAPSADYERLTVKQKPASFGTFAGLFAGKI